ncbi:MAG: hypothetical protein JSW04_13720 [Desulfobacterales bacterium]|nr:MAG: hypothetical protein JSV38_14890 [Desulfobacterales bacterium]UCD89455.1 MAG: hypothetical protein JSW04_13720 [Desulfobacterales bacterium]
MIKVKNAVKRAFEVFNELYAAKKFEDILLEEVELSDDSASWLVTIGFYRRAPSINIIESIGSKKYIRMYKTIRIDAATGKLISMKNGSWDTGKSSGNVL